MTTEIASSTTARGCSAWLGLLPLTIWLIVLGGWWCSIIENRRKDQAAMPEKDRKPPGLKNVIPNATRYDTNVRHEPRGGQGSE